MLDAAPPPPDCDVLVVGAGPIGLMAADLLKRSGVAVRIDASACRRFLARFRGKDRDHG